MRYFASLGVIYQSFRKTTLTYLAMTVKIRRKNSPDFDLLFQVPILVSFFVVGQDFKKCLVS